MTADPPRTAAAPERAEPAVRAEPGAHADPAGRAEPAGPVDPGGGAVPGRRERLVTLLQDYAGEAERLGQAFAGRHGLHPTDLHALLAVLRADTAGEPLTPGALGSRLGLTTGATTALVDRLERAGHVRRSRESADRRRVTLRPGATAAVVGTEFFGPLGTMMDTVLDGFTDADLDAAARFLTAMTALIGEYRASL